MISASVLERPSRLRSPVLFFLFLLCISPALPLIFRVLTENIASLDAYYLSAVLRSLIVAALTSVVSIGVGWPVGVLSALYEFPLKRLLLLLIALPLIVPSFLWAIGFSMLRIQLKLPPESKTP